MAPYRPRLKICGVTNPVDARLVGDSGADYCGVLVGVGFSERNLSLKQAREVASATSARVVVLLCDPTPQAALQVVEQIQPHAVQLLCHESPDFLAALKARCACRIWKTIHLPLTDGQPDIEAYVSAGADALLVDSVDTSEGFTRLGGTGKVGDWEAARNVIANVSIPVFLAGGIGPDNVAGAIAEVRPHGVDLCSGVEAVKGKKDPEKIKRLIRGFNAAQAEIQGGCS